MSKTYLGHHIIPIKGVDYILLSEYAEIQDKLLEMKILLKVMLENKVIIINGKPYTKTSGDDAITQMLLDVLERGGSNENSK